MNKTSTHHVSSLQNSYEFDVAVKALRAEKLVLFPTDTVWSLGCVPSAEPALDQITSLKRTQDPENFEILFESVEQLKHYFPALHPRLETLLSFHRRPLTLQLPGGRPLPQRLFDVQGEVAVRVVQDPLCAALIRTVGEPLVSSVAGIGEDPLPTHLGVIRSDFLQGVDYVLKLQEHFIPQSENQLSVKVRLDKKGNLVFLRD